MYHYSMRGDSSPVIALLGTQTGRGHVAVIEALRRSFETRGVVALTYPSFSEDVLPQNKFLCNFYNYLLATNLDLANAYVEFLVYSRNYSSDEYCSVVEPYISSFLAENRFDVIISNAPFIQYAFGKALLKHPSRAPWYVVVTDPFVPVMVGFECPLADHYFVATEAVRVFLIQTGIPPDHVSVTGYPVTPVIFSEVNQKNLNILKKYGLDPKKRVIACTSGAAGTPSFLTYLKAFVETPRPEQLVFVAGRNRFLEDGARRIVQEAHAVNVRVVGFIDDMPALLKCSDLLVSKAGANAVFEAIYCGTPLLIDGTATFMFQEKGVESFLRDTGVGVICKSAGEFITFLDTRFADENYMCHIAEKLAKLRVPDPSAHIVELVLQKIQGV